MKQSIKSLRYKPTFPHYFQHRDHSWSLLKPEDCPHTQTEARPSSCFLLSIGLSSFRITHTVAQGFSRCLQISGDILDWVPLIIAGNIWFTSSNDGAKGKPCFKALLIRAQKIGGQQRYSDGLGISAPEPGACGRAEVHVDLPPTRHGHATTAVCAIRHAAHVSDTAFFEIHTA